MPTGPRNAVITLVVQLNSTTRRVGWNRFFRSIFYPRVEHAYAISCVVGRSWYWSHFYAVLIMYISLEADVVLSSLFRLRYMGSSAFPTCFDGRKHFDWSSGPCAWHVMGCQCVILYNIFPGCYSFLSHFKIEVLSHSGVLTACESWPACWWLCTYTGAKRRCVLYFLIAVYCSLSWCVYKHDRLNFWGLRLYYKFQDVSKLYLTKIYIIWRCLDASKLHSSTKWPIKPMSVDIHHFFTFISITNSTWISWVFLSRFHVNRCRTRWDIENSFKTSQNMTFSIRALGTVNCNQTMSLREVVSIRIMRIIAICKIVGGHAFWSQNTTRNHPTCEAHISTTTP
jgi:hypothetical protein